MCKVGLLPSPAVEGNKRIMSAAFIYHRKLILLRVNAVRLCTVLDLSNVEATRGGEEF